MMIAVASCLQRETALSLHETSHTETLLLTSAEPSAGSGPSGDCHILKVECQGSPSHKASEFPSSARKSEPECLPGRTIASWWRLAQSFVVSHHRLFHRLKFHKGTNDLHNNRHGSWGSHMSQRICLSRCPWESCCYIPAMDAIAPQCGCSRHGSMLYPTSLPQGFGRHVSSVSGSETISKSPLFLLQRVSLWSPCCGVHWKRRVPTFFNSWFFNTWLLITAIDPSSPDTAIS